MQTYSSKTVTREYTLTLGNDSKTSPASLAVHKNGDFLFSIPFEYLYDMLLDYARENKDNQELSEPVARRVKELLQGAKR